MYLYRSSTQRDLNIFPGAKNPRSAFVLFKIFICQIFNYVLFVCKNFFANIIYLKFKIF